MRFAGGEQVSATGSTTKPHGHAHTVPLAAVTKFDAHSVQLAPGPLESALALPSAHTTHVRPSLPRTEPAGHVHEYEPAESTHPSLHPPFSVAHSLTFTHPVAGEAAGAYPALHDAHVPPLHMTLQTDAPTPDVLCPAVHAVQPAVTPGAPTPAAAFRGAARIVPTPQGVQTPFRGICPAGHTHGIDTPDRTAPSRLVFPYAGHTHALTAVG